MSEIFCYSTEHTELKVLVMLPENVCYEANTGFLLNKIIRPSGLEAKNFAFQPIPIPPRGKIKKAQIIELLEDTHNYCQTYGITTILCGSADIFKYFGRKDAKFTLTIGRTVKNQEVFKRTGKKKEIIIKEGTYDIVPLLNPVILNSYPHKVSEVKKGLDVAASLVKGTYKEPEFCKKIEINEIIQVPERALKVLKSLFKKDIIFVDIETTGLRWQKDKLLTLSIAPNDNEAYCFPLHKQYYENEETNKAIRNMVSQFFRKYKGKIVGHNWIAFDQAFIIHELFREEDFTIPHEPLISPLNLHDTMLMAYILMNSTERPSIGLKQLSFKWMGDYDKDIDQKRLEVVPLKKVAEYNNYDVIATAKIYAELSEKIVKEGFEKTYEEFRQIAKQLLKIKMNGLRVDIDKAKELEKELQYLIAVDKNVMLSNEYVKEAEIVIAQQKAIKAGKPKQWESFKEEFNPGSPYQKQVLFFDVMGLPVIKKSKTTKDPSADAQVLNEWLSDPTIPSHKKEVIEAINEYQLAKKIESTYIKVILESAMEVAPNDYRIFANFNQTSTISGRLSSSGDINFQTIPSSSKYAKPVKELFIAPDDFLIATADYSALEDRLIANESKDPNKIAIFQKGIDGHCLNAYAYFKDDMPDIEDKLKYLESEEEFYEVILPNGEVEYYAKSDPEFKKLMEEYDES